MANSLNLPTLQIDFLRPGKFTVDVIGSSIDGGRNALGQGISIETSGGGIVVVDIDRCQLLNGEQHEYQNWLAARLNGSIRAINVPILSDWMGPFPKTNGIPKPVINGIPHSDGALFSDGSGYSQASVYGEVTASALSYAGILNLSVTGAERALRMSDWFSIYHPVKKGWRAYRYWQVLSGTMESPTYQLAIDPPLREAVAEGTRVEFARPLCAMAFPAKFSLAYSIERHFESYPSLKFIEAP